MAVVTRRTFQGAADRIRTSGLAPAAKAEIIEIFVAVFSELNPSFDEDKFRKACGS